MIEMQDVVRDVTKQMIDSGRLREVIEKKLTQTNRVGGGWAVFVLRRHGKGVAGLREGVAAGRL